MGIVQGIVQRFPFQSRFNSVSFSFQNRFKIVSFPFQNRFNIVSFPFQNRFKNGIKVDVARNPCPCGYYPDRNKCKCSEVAIERYQRGISKPILERIDICAESSPIKFDEITAEIKSESSEEIKKRVCAARLIQKERFKNSKKLRFNSQMTVIDIKKYCALDSEEKEYLRTIFKVKKLSARTYHKLLKVARTIADLSGSEKIMKKHLAEAANFRGLEEKIYG